MSETAAEPGRTGRGRGRHPAEAPPAAGQPEDQPAIGQAEAEAAVTEGIYFAKAPNRDVWHAYDEEHEAVGSVYNDGEKWKVRVNRVDLKAVFGSAASARSCLMGWFLRGEQERSAWNDQHAGAPVRTLPGQPGGDRPEGSGTPAATATGTDAGHDASRSV